MGAEAFAERTRRELSATGETVRRRSVGMSDELTSQLGISSRKQLREAFASAGAHG